MALLDRFRGFARRSIESGDPGVEGQPKTGPWWITNADGWLPSEWGKFLNFWQMDFDPLPGASNAIVQACVSAYAQTIAQCPGDHWRLDDDGGRERVTTSALSRILRRPNDYQSRSDFVLGLARDLYQYGNTYALAVRNDRFEVASLHPFDPRKSQPIVSQTGDVFYRLNGNSVIEQAMRGTGSPFVPTSDGLLVPSRDVLHIKLDPLPDDPLVGVSPAQHAGAAVAAQRAISSQLLSFFGNMSRPSGVLETDHNLTADQVKLMRDRWNDQARGLNAGGVPILTNGVKFHGISQTARDAELTAALKLTQEEIFIVYGVPPAILGITDKSNFGSTEALMQFWLARGLGFAINHIEVGLDHFFGLKGWPDEYVELDTRALLRVAYKDRIDGLVRGVQGALYSPNEARRMEDLPDVEFGEEPRVQQQVVPLSAWAQTEPQTPRPDAADAPPSAPDNADDTPSAEDQPAEPPADTPTKQIDPVEVRDAVARMWEAKRDAA